MAKLNGPLHPTVCTTAMSKTGHKNDRNILKHLVLARIEYQTANILYHFWLLFPFCLLKQTFSSDKKNHSIRMIRNYSLYIYTEAEILTKLGTNYLYHDNVFVLNIVGVTSIYFMYKTMCLISNCIITWE